VAALGALSVTLLAYKDGPPPNMAGGFGGETCRMCHTGNPIDQSGGALRITGLPASYRLGVTYPIAVTLTRDALYIGGFQMTARTRAGQSAGTWRALDDRTKVAGPFIQHTLRGSRAAADGENRWAVEWTAPDSALGEVVFNAAGNASNDDASALGDFIYTFEQSVAGPDR
jgi:hypothetical protein